MTTKLNATRSERKVDLEKVGDLNPEDVVKLKEHGRMEYIGAGSGIYRRDTMIFIGRERTSQGDDLIRGIGVKINQLNIREDGGLDYKGLPVMDRVYSEADPAFMLLHGTLDRVKIFPKE